jgi:hypothetical protein
MMECHGPVSLDDLELKIAEHGVMVINVATDRARGLPPLAYSVGLQDMGFPELVLTGEANPYASTALVNNVIAWLLDRKAPPRPGEVIPAKAKIVAHGFLLRFRPLSEVEVENNLLLAVARSYSIGREPPQAFQLVYQDPDRRWPEERGYKCHLALMLAQDEKETQQ